MPNKKENDQPEVNSESVESPNIDVVSMVSLKADGTPDQTPGWKFLDEEAGQDAKAEQLKQTNASNKSVAEAEKELNDEGK